MVACLILIVAGALLGGLLGKLIALLYLLFGPHALTITGALIGAIFGIHELVRFMKNPYH